jgi:hypothetical protein
MTEILNGTSAKESGSRSNFHRDMIGPGQCPSRGGNNFDFQGGTFSFLLPYAFSKTCCFPSSFLLSKN